MKDYYVLTFKESGERKGYTTLAAISEDNLKDQIGVSKSTLEKFDFYVQDYENSIVTIEMITFKTRGEIIREREKFL